MAVPMISLRRMSPKPNPLVCPFRSRKDGAETLPDLCANG